MRNTGPCLCGDPYCRRCFPAGNPEWRIDTLDDGRQWLTDGTFGMNPDAAPALLAALKALFENCAMIHKHWGDICNQKQADTAIRRAEAAIALAEA